MIFRLTDKETKPCTRSIVSRHATPDAFIIEISHWGNRVNPALGLCEEEKWGFHAHAPRGALYIDVTNPLHPRHRRQQGEGAGTNGTANLKPTT